MSKNYPIVEGAEGNRVGILVSHGFTDSTQSMMPLGEALRKQAIRYAVLV